MVILSLFGVDELSQHERFVCLAMTKKDEVGLLLTRFNYILLLEFMLLA